MSASSVAVAEPSCREPAEPVDPAFWRRPGVVADPDACAATTSVRSRAAARTLDAIRPLLDEVGIARVIDVGIAAVPACPVYQVLRHDMRSAYFNAGKGYSNVESLVSGLMEAIEVHCFERAAADRLLPPDPPSHAAAAGAVEHWSARALGLDASHLTDAARVAGRHLISGLPVSLPAAAVWQDAAFGPSCATPNGVASGNDESEALVHALCELLERHALAGFVRGTPAAADWVLPPQLPAVQTCLQQLHRVGIAADLLHISSMAGVAVFIAFLSLHDDDRQLQVVQGYGAHVDPAIAAARALAEAVQILALCPVRALSAKDGDADRSKRRGATPVVMTSKQSALLDGSNMTRQRRADAALLARLKQQWGPPAAMTTVFDPERLRPRGNPDAVLAEVIDGLQAEGIGHALVCTLSPPAWPVVVVKAFCPALSSIDGL